MGLESIGRQFYLCIMSTQHPNISHRLHLSGPPSCELNHYLRANLFFANRLLQTAHIFLVCVPEFQYLILDVGDPAALERSTT